MGNFDPITAAALAAAAAAKAAAAAAEHASRSPRPVIEGPLAVGGVVGNADIGRDGGDQASGDLVNLIRDLAGAEPATTTTTVPVPDTASEDTVLDGVEDEVQPEQQPDQTAGAGASTRPGADAAEGDEPFLPPDSWSDAGSAGSAQNGTESSGDPTGAGTTMDPGADDDSGVDDFPGGSGMGHGHGHGYGRDGDHGRGGGNDEDHGRTDDDAEDA